MELWSLSHSLKVQYYNINYCETSDGSFVSTSNKIDFTVDGKFSIVHLTVQILKEIHDPAEVCSSIHTHKFV